MTAQSRTKTEFCELIGRSPAQVERYFQLGLPHKKTGRKVLVPWPDGRRWYDDHLIAKAKREAQPTSIDDARRRKETAQAALEELKLAREQNLTMRVADHEHLLADAFGRVRAKLMNFAARGAGAVFGAISLTDAQAKLEPLVLEMLEELAAGEDVPDPDEELAPT